MNTVKFGFTLFFSHFPNLFHFLFHFFYLFSVGGGGGAGHGVFCPNAYRLCPMVYCFLLFVCQTIVFFIYYCTCVSMYLFLMFETK